MAATASAGVALIESRSLASPGVELVEAHISRIAADGPACGHGSTSQDASAFLTASNSMGESLMCDCCLIDLRRSRPSTLTSSSGTPS
jgi:hypothetical protein